MDHVRVRQIGVSSVDWLIGGNYPDAERNHGSCWSGRCGESGMLSPIRVVVCSMDLVNQAGEYRVSGSASILAAVIYIMCAVLMLSGQCNAICVGLSRLGGGE